MASLLEKSTKLLAKTMLRSAGMAIVYRRGIHAVQLMAVPGRTLIDDYSLDGNPQTAIADDWILPAADLVLDGVETLPKDGDEIDVGDDNHRKTYRVLPAGGDRCFRFVDQARNLLRTHAKEIRPKVDA